MRNYFIAVFLILFSGVSANAQADTTKWLRAFPITDYMVSLNDSVKVVQLEMPEQVQLKEKQLGLLYGKYKTSINDAVEKGYGRCHLIKSNYYYFSIGKNKSGLPFEKGDLLYVNMPPTSIYYGRIPRLAGHFIKLLNVYEDPLYDRYLIFDKWTISDENKLTDSLVADIRFTGDYFLQNNPAMNVTIATGDFAGRKVLEVMSHCTRKDVEDFLDYILARPRLYAGGEWKVAEIFATWANSGAPKVIK
ncbi:MAG: hypothetical protein NTW29_20215 [Bacteroidetes bacterium]|nr:hypothetical protein [Bacteroidota bacterium]